MIRLLLLSLFALPFLLAGCPPGGGGSGDDDSAAGTPSSTPTASQSALSVAFSDLSFTHTYGSSPCPQAIGTATITNSTDVDASYTLADSGTLVSFSSAAGTIPAGESVTVDIQFNCGGCGDFTSTVTATVTNGAKSNEVSGPVTGTFNGCP